MDINYYHYAIYYQVKYFTNGLPKNNFNKKYKLDSTLLLVKYYLGGEGFKGRGGEYSPSG
ncbi:hypothetical protein MTATph1_CDS0218 [Moorella phage MTATph1]